MDPFLITRVRPEVDEFEEDLHYFDLPGKVEEDFVVKVDEFIATLGHVSAGTAKKLQELLLTYRSLFPANHLGMPGIKGYKFGISVDPAVPPIRRKQRPLNDMEKSTILEHVDAMLTHGIISPTTSPWAFQVVLAPKADGTLRFCINFRPLNEITVKDRYPLPRIEDCVRSFSGRKFFSTMDCFAGYWQVDLEEAARQYCSFVTPFGTYCFNKLPFGLSNAPSFFQSVMEHVFHEFLYDFLVVYLDDLGIGSDTEEDHLVHLEKVFKMCLKWGICLKFSKCSFFATQFRYLGILLSADGLLPDPAKVSCLLDRPAPTNVREARSFVCFGSYFRMFLDHYADLVEPIQKLLRKGVPWVWSVECQEVFEGVKCLLSKAPLLKQPDGEHTFVLSTDASRVALGAVLEQFCTDGSLRPVAYYSRRFQAAELNYMTYEQEGLALVSSVKHFRQYLLGNKFIVYTDNSAIASIFKEKEPCGRMVRWIHVLTEYDCEVRHRAGKLNPVADFMSRPSILYLSCPVGLGSRPDISFQEIQAYLESGSLDSSLNDGYFRRVVRRYALVEGSLYFRSKIGLLKVLFSLSELADILKKLHDSMGHPGLSAVWDWVRNRYFRPHLYSEVKNFVDSCEACQKFALFRPAYKFDGKSSLSGLFVEWCCDFLGPFPVSAAGSRYLCVFVEKLSGFPFVKAVPDETSLSSCSVLKELVSLFGCPRRVSCDQGTCFTGRSFRNLCSQLCIDLSFLPAYTPEWAGSVERLNRTLRYSLAASVGGDYSNWCSYLSGILYGIRSRVHSRTGYSPFFLFYGVHPTLPVSGGSQEVSVDLAARFLELDSLPGVRSDLVREVAHSSTLVKFNIGSFVLSLSPSLRKRSIRDKKAPRYEGPWKVLSVLPHNLYSCLDERGRQATFHVSRLVSFIPRLVHSSLGGTVAGDTFASLARDIQTRERV